MVTDMTDLPTSVQNWFAAETSSDPVAALRAALAPDVLFDFGGRRVEGIDAVITAIGFVMPPNWLGEVQWTIVSTDADAVMVRGTRPGGGTLASPGGPMSAIDYRFDLDARGLIACVRPQPHHLEPPGLRAPLRPGETAPSFNLPDVDGTAHGFAPAGGAVSVVIFTCNHCPFSLAWHDRVQRAIRDYVAGGVRFLQINPNDPATNARDGVEFSRKRVAGGEFASPYLIDEGQQIARQWGARHTPELFVIDRSGVVAYHGAPDADVSDESGDAGWLRDALDDVLADRVPDPADTAPVGCSIKWTM